MPTPLHEDPFSHYHSIYAYVFQLISFLQVFPSKPCTYFSSTPIRATCSNHLLLDMITLITTQLIVCLIILNSGFQPWCNLTNPQASFLFYVFLFSSLHKHLISSLVLSTEDSIGTYEHTHIFKYTTYNTHKTHIHFCHLL